MELTRWLEAADAAGDGEHTETLLTTPGLRLSRIVSRGHSSAPGYWYDQDEHEYVLVLAGEAELSVEGVGNVALGPGDACLLPRRTRHRVERTASDGPTIWLALFFTGEIAEGLGAETVERILTHMNADHADSVLDYARALAGVLDARAARMTDVDGHGMGLEVETAEGARQLRLPFEPPVADAADARRALVAMAHEARRRLG